MLPVLLPITYPKRGCVMTPDDTPAPALLTLKLIRQHYVPIAERTFWKWVSTGQFPRPDISIGTKIRYWKRETIEEWIQENGCAETAPRRRQLP